MSRSKTYLDLVKATDSYPLVDISQKPYADDAKDSLYQLLLPNDPRPHGFLLPSTVQKMPWTSDFHVSHAPPRTVQLRDRSEGQDTAAACSAAFREVVSAATESGIFGNLSRAFPEDYKVLGAGYAGPATGRVQLLRAAAGLFGICCRGAHMTVYTRSGSGGASEETASGPEHGGNDIRIWVPRRSRHLKTWPGRLDTTVAGGVRAEETPWECILHEADEEASLPAELVRKCAKPTGVVTYVAESAAGSGGDLGLCVPDVLYCYDMEVPEHVKPVPRDDEVEEFYLMTVDQVKEALLREEFKTNCASVMIDFFVRHGIITDDNEPDYLEIVTRLRRTLPVPTSPVRG